MHDPAFRATSPPVVAPQVRRQSEALITGREKVVLFGRPLRRSRHESADHDAGVSLYGQHVPIPRVSRAGGQFEFRVALLHLRILPHVFIWKNEMSPTSAAARPARFSASGTHAVASSASRAPYRPLTRARRPSGVIMAISV